MSIIWWKRKRNEKAKDEERDLNKNLNRQRESERKLAPPTKETKQPSTNFHYAAMDHMPKSQHEIVVIFGDRLGVLEVSGRYEGYARVMNCRTMSMLLVPMSVVGD
jgi:hypothetical protein